MNHLLYYLLQVICSSGIFYLYYCLALRNKKFHQYNRFYLLAATLISMLVPFLNIPVYFSRHQTESSLILQALAAIYSSSAEESITSVAIQQPSAHSFVLSDFLYYGYGLIAGFALVRIVLSLLRIRRIARHNTVQQFGDIKLVNTTEPGTPFSFFGWLFWNRNIELRSEKGEQVFRHELFHIRQKHSLDLLFMELLTVVFWINPFFHLVKRELRTVHEFLADQFAAEENEKWNYAELLLMHALKTKHSLVNPFFHNQIKRRIAMITNPQKTSHQYLRKLFVLPVTAAVLTLFAFKYRNHNADLPGTENKTTIVVDAGHRSADPGLVSHNGKVDEAALTLENGKAVIDPAFPGGENKWREYVYQNMPRRMPGKNGAPAGAYTVFANFIVHADGSISDVRTLTNLGFGMEEALIDAIKKSPKWVPAIQNGRKVDAYKKLSWTFVVEKFEVPNKSNIFDVTVKTGC